MLSKFIRCGFVSLFWTKAYSTAQKALLGPHAPNFDYLKLHIIVFKMAFGVPRLLCSENGGPSNVCA